MTMPKREEIHPVLLRVLSSWEGVAKPKAVINTVTREFPQLTREDLAELKADGGSKWENRVRWARQDLVITGMIDPSIRGNWQLTEEGRKQAATLAPPQEYPEPEPEAVAVNEDEVEPEGPEPPPEPPRVLLSEHEALAAELRAAALDSAAPTRLEHAVARAMRFFGFEARAIGGSGRTDVLADAVLGPRRYRVVLDAKSSSKGSSSKGRVNENQINWLAINQHRQQEGATYAVVVGPEFAGGTLKSHAEEFDACLLRADDLADLVLLHAQHPLSLIELSAVFRSSPDGAAALPGVRAAAQARALRIALLRFLLDRIELFNTQAADTIMAKPEVLWGQVVGAGDQSVQGATMEDVAAALELLATIGALSGSAAEGYVSQTSRDGALRMLAAIAQVDQDAQVEAPADQSEQTAGRTDSQPHSTAG